MSRTKAEQAMTFTLHEAADILNVEPHWIKNRIQEGLIVPAERGGKGKGKVHKFSLPQMVGLTVGLWWYLDVGKGRQMLSTHFKETYDRYSLWTQEEAEALVGLRTDESDPWTAEALAKRLASEHADSNTRADDLEHVVRHPEDRPLTVKFVRRLMRLHEPAKAKLSLPDPDRIMASLREAAGLPKSKTSKSKK